MNFFEVLGLDREPFSTSPDPQFFFLSATHQISLKRLEITLRLRRGLSIIYGDVGTGKTTLSRALIQSLSSDPSFSFHMILDPHYPSQFQFLAALTSAFGIPANGRSTVHYKTALNEFLFTKGAEEGKVPVLIVDEGQEIPTFALEILRLLLNYETNDAKLLQVIIFSQMELLKRIEKKHNLQDRVAFRYLLRPLTLKETGEMINFRLKAAGYTSKVPLFTPDAIQRIHSVTEGYPRKTVMLCHDALETLVIREERQVNSAVIDELLVSPFD